MELVLVVRKLFHECRLVHADLSEYNILYHDSHLYIIDVSQSVEHDHPAAFDFLRKDITNVEEFFQRLGVNCLGLRRCFEFVTKDSLERQGEESDEGVLKRMLVELPTTAEDSASMDQPEKHEDAIFMQSYIPRTLNDVYDPERDLDKVQASNEKPIYADTIGVVMPEANVVEEPLSGTEEDESSEAEDDEESSFDKQPRGHRHEDKDAKKVTQSPLTHMHIFMVFSGEEEGCEGGSQRKAQEQDAQGREKAHAEENRRATVTTLEWH